MSKVKVCEACGRIDQGVPECLAESECQDKYIVYLTKSNRAMAALNEANPKQFRAMILARHTAITGVKRMAKESKPREKKEKEPTYSEFSGEETAGGTFLPGEDAKLKGILGRQFVTDDDLDAYVELRCRNWPIPAAASEEQEADGKAALVKITDREAWLEKRVAARHAQIDKGMSLEDIYGPAFDRKYGKSKAKAEKAPAAKKAAGKKTPAKPRARKTAAA